MRTRVSDILAPFRRLGIIKRGRVNERALSAVSFGSLVDAADDSAQVTSTVDDAFDAHLDSYCASVELAGSREYCGDLDCRYSKIEELSRYAALYAETVVIHNHCADYAPSIGHPPDKDTDWFRERVASDLKVILKTGPLIDAGLIVPLTPVRTVCPACSAALLFGAGADKRFDAAKRQLRKRFFAKTDVEFSYDPETQQYNLECSGPQPLFDHTNTTWFNHTPRENLAEMPRTMAKVHAGETVTLSKTAKRKSGVHNDCADLRMDLLWHQIFTSQMIGTSILTDQELHKEVLDTLSSNQHRQTISPSNLDVIVPFAGDVPISKLTRLREREQDSFVMFRAALRSAANEYSDSDGRLTKRRAQELYADVIEPSLATLDKKVKKAKRDLVAVPLKSAAATIAALGVGIYTGVIPAELAAAAQSLGASKVIYDTVVRAAEHAGVKDRADNAFYFLWKVKHASPQRGHK